MRRLFSREVTDAVAQGKRPEYLLQDLANRNVGRHSPLLESIDISLANTDALSMASAKVVICRTEAADVRVAIGGGGKFSGWDGQHERCNQARRNNGKSKIYSFHG